MASQLVFVSSCASSLACADAAWRRRPRGAADSRTLPTITPTLGMTIDQSVRDRARALSVAGGGRPPRPMGRRCAIQRRQHHVDLTGVTIEGGDPLADPDGYEGTGCSWTAAAASRFRGGAIRGYKVGVLARRSSRAPHHRPRRQLQLEAAAVQRHREGEPRRLAVVPRQREGRVAALRRGHLPGRVRRRRGRQQPGRAGPERPDGRRDRRDLKIWNNTFSWLSGVGIGLYRTTDSAHHAQPAGLGRARLQPRLLQPRPGFGRAPDVRTVEPQRGRLQLRDARRRRPVSLGRPVHDGHGAGRANDNLFFGNDFSHAVANGIEATFSRNQFVRNRIDDCWHGVWGGYSYDTAFRDNTFAATRKRIAIEHGQNIAIAGNTFIGDQTAIRLWANAVAGSQLGLSEERATRAVATT